MGKKSYSVDNVIDLRPKLWEYANLSNEVKIFVDDLIKNSIKSHEKLIINNVAILPKRKTLWLVSWSDLILIREFVKETNMEEVLKIIYKLRPEKLKDIDLFNCFAVWKWINEELSAIYELEKQELFEENTADEKNAGIERLAVFGHSLAIDNLCGGDPIKEEALLKKPYMDIFKRLVMKKIKREVNEAHQDIKHKQNVSKQNSRNRRK